MNKAKLKAYAPQARKDFIAAVTARANQLGLSDTKGELIIAPATRQGDVTLIDGREWPAKVFAQRETLIKRLRKDGFQQVVEAIACTWFNRFAALRYMEIHDYLGHGYRVLSSTADSTGAHTPDILLHAVDLAASQALPGLNAGTVNQLKLAGNQDAELYSRLLIAQCNGLSQAMPFLFERIDDDSELLLPDNLLRTDSVIANLVNEIPEEDWENVEIVGWLYQFYISEKKDQVIGKVVKSEDIPAATQLFTPNWIVQYLVQNSVGRLWMMANPQSTLKSQWPYYIEPSEQTAEVNAQLATLIQTRMDEDGGSLNPESITVLDPACGSGHILVEAYELLKGIYLERGYRLRDVPRLILEKNLFGLDIDDRAAQMAGFALLMKARADDRRLFEEPIALNVLSLQESRGLSQQDISTALASYGIQPALVQQLLETFENAKTFGSLIQIAANLNEQLPKLAEALSQASQSGDLYEQSAAKDLLPLVWQGLIIGRQYDAVVANPPYMGSKGMNPALKDYAKRTFPDSKSDLFAMFMERGFTWCKPLGFNSMVTMQSWMFLSSYESLREKLLQDQTISCMVHMGNGVMGIAFGTAATVILNNHIPCYEGSFSYCENDDVGANERPKQFPVHNERLKTAKPDDFKKIPGGPIAYWASQNLLSIFQLEPSFSAVCYAGFGIKTGDNTLFMREWSEVFFNEIVFNGDVNLDRSMRWYPCASGGPYKKWYGNQNLVVNYKNEGSEIEEYSKVNGNSYGFNAQKYYFKKSITWPKLTSSINSFRETPPGHIFDGVGLSAFFDSEENFYKSLCALNTNLYSEFINIIAPTVSFTSGDFLKLPFPASVHVDKHKVLRAVALAKSDWDSCEISFNFGGLPWLTNFKDKHSLSKSWEVWADFCSSRLDEMKNLQESFNANFINAYALQSELSPEVSADQISLTPADRDKDCQRLISFGIGCMMGRYRLDEPGLIYAHSGNVAFEPGRYVKFSADADGIVPITGILWFEDDAANRVREFVQVVWGAETLEENMTWLAESLGKKESETADETIRRYLADKFYKDHLQTYKKRPIYWLFSSGKQGAFQALVYLHRYNEGTLARMRAEYVVPLTGKIQARIDMLVKDAESAGSTASRNKINKEIDKLRKQHVELLAYDEKLRHYADMRIKLDLDDGVKVNYGKFGDLLAEVKAVTGGSSDE